MSLVLTRTQNMRADSNLDKFELRPSRYGALNAFIEQSNDPNGILTPELKEKARVSIGSTLETPVIDYDGNISIGNTRDVLIGDSENTSRMVQITFATYAWGFTIAPAAYMNNEISIQRDFQVKMMKYIYAFAKALDAAALSVLAADKTQVLSNPLLYNFSGSTLAATFNQRENLLSDLEVMMGADDFFNQLDIVGDAGVESLVKKLAQKDIYNVVNKRNEYAGKTFHFTNSIATDADLFAQGYAIEKGSIGMMTRFERDCLLGTRSADGHEWSIVTLPMLGIPCGAYFYDSVGNYSGIVGDATADMTRTRKEHYGFAVDVAFLTAYNSSVYLDQETKRPSPILAFTIDNAGAQYGMPVKVVNDENSPVYTASV